MDSDYRGFQRIRRGVGARIYQWPVTRCWLHFLTARQTGALAPA
jgi:hypothetical protein